MKNRANNDLLTQGIGQKASHGFRRGTGRTLAVVVGLMACLSMQTLSAQSGSPSATAASAAANDVSNRPARRIDDPADIAALTRFLTDFSPRKDELERRAALLVGLAEVQLKKHSESLVRGEYGLRGWRLYVSYPPREKRNAKILVEIGFPAQSCISDRVLQQVVANALENDASGHNEDLTKRETFWKEQSGGPDWPAGMVVRSRNIGNKIIASYYYNDVVKCSTSLRLYYSAN